VERSDPRLDHGFEKAHVGHEGDGVGREGDGEG
jgi:hypothetical protein